MVRQKYYKIANSKYLNLRLKLGLFKFKKLFLLHLCYSYTYRYIYVTVIRIDTFMNKSIVKDILKHYFYIYKIQSKLIGIQNLREDNLIITLKNIKLS